MPGVQAVIKDAFKKGKASSSGTPEPTTHLNDDNLVSNGAAYIAANITAQYPVKKIYLS